MTQGETYSLGQRLVYWLATNLAGRLLRLIFKTCRVERLSQEVEEHYFGNQLPVIGVTWHRHAIYFLHYYAAQKPAIMISRSKDGEFLARYLKMMGGIPVRGSSRRGGLAALKTMVEMVHDGRVSYAATVADGPNGPRYVAKKGMIILAQRTGLPLLPLMWSTNRAWVFKGSWDRTCIPKPFARIKVAVGRPFIFTGKMSPEQMEEARRDLEREMNRLKDYVDGLTGYQDPA